MQINTKVYVTRLVLPDTSCFIFNKSSSHDNRQEKNSLKMQRKHQNKTQVCQGYGNYQTIDLKQP